MSRPVLFVQGSGEGAYQEDAALAASLAGALGAGYRVAYPPMPEEAGAADAPDAGPAAWMRRIAEAAAAQGDGVVLVGHSMGAALLLAALAGAGPWTGPWPTVAGVFLVAAPFVGPGGWELDEFALPADLARRLPPGVPLVFYHSPDDATVPLAHAGLYAKELPGAVFRRPGRRGPPVNPGPGGGAAARNDFSSAAVKNLLMPISPMMPAMTSGWSAPPPTSSTMKAVASSRSMRVNQSGWDGSR